MIKVCKLILHIIWQISDLYYSFYCSKVSTCKSWPKNQSSINTARSTNLECPKSSKKQSSRASTLPQKSPKRYFRFSLKLSRTKCRLLPSKKDNKAIASFMPWEWAVFCREDRLQEVTMWSWEFTTSSKESTKTLSCSDFSTDPRVFLLVTMLSWESTKLTISKTEEVLIWYVREETKLRSRKSSKSLSSIANHSNLMVWLSSGVMIQTPMLLCLPNTSFQKDLKLV